MADLDAVVVGAGPNGLAAALTLAAAGLSVRVVEGADTVGGGCRTAELTEPGVRHDVCSTVHPLAAASPFFTWLGLQDRGVELLHPEVAFAHPLDGGPAGAVVRSVDETSAGLGAAGKEWQRTFGPLADRADAIVPAVLAPLRGLPRQPVRAARYAPIALRSAAGVAGRFDDPRARALVAGVSAHAMLPLDRLPTGAFGALLTVLAHSVGWPVVRGGSQVLVDVLTRTLREWGGEVVTGQWVSSLDELPPSRVVLLDVAPSQLAGIAGDRLPKSYRASLRRYRYGPGVCKVDWTLSGPVPWLDEACRRAGTVHVGGTFEQVAAAEAEVAAGRHPEQPFVLAVQPTVVDPSRAPAGRHVLWAYCHVPPYSTVDMTAAIEAQIERFAPGFRDLVVARSTLTAADEQELHPNYVGGDINVGMATLRQMLFRPTVRWDQYSTPDPSVFLCGSATPPGGGVHGMCGQYAARSALRRMFGVRSLPAAPAPDGASVREVAVA
ncbi:MAG TPA: NAD(P)/FAD-dependent oxidoreductase [Mycobacteriales bacterium]|jgi:phytoene dehydrogenase-like protein|nr:NAD(P)/FAD-dependent oxidoreductase [Mycobacteriales bacterium]